MGKRFYFLCAVAGLALGCGDDGGGAASNTDGETETDTDGTTSTSTMTTMGMTSETTPVTSLTQSTTMTMSTTMGETETVDTSTGGDIGVCIGLSQVGTAAVVHARTGTNITPGCDATPAGCGGDLVDTWDVTEVCGLEDFPNFADDECPGATQTVNSADVTGSRTFNDDDTYSFDFTTMLDLSINLDAMTCFGLDCDAYAVAASVDGITATCTAGEEGTCDCNLVLDASEQTTGTWSVAGNVVTIVPDDPLEDTEEIEYCITGDRLDSWTPLIDLEIFADTFCEDEQDCIDQLADASDQYVCFMGEAE